MSSPAQARLTATLRRLHASRSSGRARSPLLRLTFHRFFQALPVILCVTFFTFSMLNLLPGTAASALLPEGASPEQVRVLSKTLGLDQPFVPRYLHWIGHAATGDLGSSFSSGVAVTSILSQRLPATLELIVLAFVLSLGLAVPVAVLAARKPGGIVDRVSVFAGLVGLSVPIFVLGLVLVLVFAVRMHVLPAQGYVPLSDDLWQNLKAMILPASTIAFPLFCHYSRILRADIIDQLNTGAYIDTARAKGLSPWRILTRHALRNSIFSTLTLVGLNLGTMIGGTVVVEQIFGLPGIGQELVTAIEGQDIQVVEGIVLVLAIAVVTANLVTDLLTLVLDPRIRYGRAIG